jgi:26S proteasome regulatory subunit N9
MATATGMSDPELCAVYRQLSELFSRKLLHQLTVTVLDLVSSSSSSSSSSRHLELYERVVLACDSKLNQLSLARIASHVASSCSSPTMEEGQQILNKLLEKRARLGSGATLFLESKLVLIALRNNSKDEEQQHQTYENVNATLQRGAKLLAEMEAGGTDLIVYSAYYEAATAYRKLVGPPEAFYKEALLYLHYTPMEAILEEERYTLATDLSLAALTGDGIFNFGEITTTNAPLLHALIGTPNAWLIELLRCFAMGDVVAFSQVMSSMQQNTTAASHPVLSARAHVVQEKITLLSLVHMIFERPSSERTLSFDDISERTKITKINVELLLMRALSLGLIKGTMDQVDETIIVSWIMPRVLEPMQLKELAGRFGEWAIKVSQAKSYLVEQTPTFA